MRRLLLNLFVGCAVVGALTSGLSGAPVAWATVSRADVDEPGTPINRDWRGGPVSLPIGREHLAYEILNAARALPQTQDLEALFYSRGYIRRIDLDEAGCIDSMSYAVIGWEKPGVPVAGEAPVIRIISKSYFDTDLGRRAIATEAFAGVVRDSADHLATWDSGPDAAVAVVEIVPEGTPGAIVSDPGKLPQANDMTTPYRFAYHEGPGGIGRAIKDGVAATCPFRRSLAKIGVLFSAGAIRATNPWAGGILAVSSYMALEWIDHNMTCK